MPKAKTLAREQARVGTFKRHERCWGKTSWVPASAESLDISRIYEPAKA